MESTIPGVDDAVDLLLTYDWPYDEPFVGLLTETARRANKSVMVVGPESLPAALRALLAGRIHLRDLLHQARVNEWALLQGSRHLQ